MKKVFALYISNGIFRGYYCGFWQKYLGMEYYPIIIENVTDSTTYKSESKQLKTYTSYARAVNGRESCLKNIGSDWLVEIRDITQLMEERE